ncbi:phosphate signaling complex protein PhoU [Pontibacter arcticus]|uniref:Phosphate-specific transport system accessory protein PhoU n=1 Tax=Pontibacter arcticus TaxID=2080288 RepID=A0A364RI36_9BACT|nr:phosphate signaling complex protein PhoU [Pontibacter arcticus]RAU83969.1 phosphate transport system regulatory protein PhoU [Pontibacter arcticus]
MSHIDKELKQIQEKLLEMWDLVEYQLISSREALLHHDLVLAERVVKLGKKVNRYDTKIDRQCENFFALFTPVAVDLRQILATIKINANLERIGDTAEGICRIVKKLNGPLSEPLAQESRLLEMYDITLVMLADARKVLTNYDADTAHAILKQDKVINKIYRKSDKTLVDFMHQNPANVATGLQLYTLIKKMERVGDQITNITEEIIFYHDAKMIKHRSDKKKKNRNKDDN